jgi:hypothetical protein
MVLVAASGINGPAIVAFSIFGVGIVVLAVSVLRWGFRHDAAARASRAERGTLGDEEEQDLGG